MIKYIGWMRFRNTGEPFRRWEFLGDCPAVGAKKGDFLEDSGPRSGRSRFAIRRSGKPVEWPTDAKVQKELFFGTLPAFRPLREDQERVLAGLEGIADAIRVLTYRLPAATPTPSPKPATIEAQGPANRFLRLKGEHEYNNGDAYKEWELLVDVPEIPVTRVSGITPMHAVKGDVLREKDDDQLTPFELRRDGKRIGDPEWWQVRHLFDGLREFARDEPAGNPTDARALLYKLIPGGPRKMWSERREGSGLIFMAYEALASVPTVGISAGDLIVRVRHGTAVQIERAIRCPRRRVPRSLTRTLRDYVDHFRGVDGSYDLPTVEELRTFLKIAARNGKEDTVPLFILRSRSSSVSEPIDASNDAHALFELLAQVGGKMPTGEEA